MKRIIIVARSEQTISLHAGTWRGLRNALRTARATQGDAEEILITALHVTAPIAWWEDLLALMEGQPFDFETVIRYSRHKLETSAT